MPFSRILNRVLSYTEYGPEYHIDNQKVTKRPAVVDKIQQNDKTSLCYGIVMNQMLNNTISILLLPGGGVPVGGGGR